MSAGPSRVIKNERPVATSHPGLDSPISWVFAPDGAESRGLICPPTAFSQGGIRGAIGPPPGPSRLPVPAARPPTCGLHFARRAVERLEKLRRRRIPRLDVRAERPVEHPLQRLAHVVALALRRRQLVGGLLGQDLLGGEARETAGSRAGRSRPPPPGCRGPTAGPPARPAAARGSRTAASRSGWSRRRTFPAAPAPDRSR